MTIEFPEGIKSLGNTSIVAATTIVDPDAVTKAELTTATGVVNASCFFYNVPNGTATAARGDKPRRACERKARQGFGIETIELESLQYTHNPQAAMSDPANKVKATLTPYTTKWLAFRDGLPADTESIDTGDVVDLYKVELGPQNKTKTGDDDQAEYSITQDVTVVERYLDVTVVAGA